MLAQEAVSDIGLFGDQKLMLFLHVAYSWPVGSGTAEPQNTDNGCFHPMSRLVSRLAEIYGSSVLGLLTQQSGCSEKWALRILASLR